MKTALCFRRLRERTILGVRPSSTSSMIAKLRATVVRQASAAGDCIQNALQRPVNKWQCEDADTFECAAGYAFGTAKAHAFVGGNRQLS